ncbi:MAG: copper chaperone PCu(A)C [Luteimonas sp.]
MCDLDVEWQGRYHRAMHPILMKAVTAASMLLLAGSAIAADCLPRVRDGWIRLAPVGVSIPMLAGFGRIENPCAKSTVITGATSPSFADVSMHRTSVADGISRMRAVPVLTLAGNAGATLEPGGLHLMLMQPKAALKPGDIVRIVLQLQDGRQVGGDFVMRETK